MSEESTARKPIQRILIIVSGLFFLGSTIFGLIGMFTGEAQQPQINNNSDNSSNITEQLKAQEIGYQKVLEREPNNPIALQGLADARLKLNNLEGAVEPLEKLVKLYPQEASLQALLTEVKKQIDTSKQTPIKTLEKKK